MRTLVLFAFWTSCCSASQEIFVREANSQIEIFDAYLKAHSGTSFAKHFLLSRQPRHEKIDLDGTTEGLKNAISFLESEVFHPAEVPVLIELYQKMVRSNLKESLFYETRLASLKKLNLRGNSSISEIDNFIASEKIADAILLIDGMPYKEVNFPIDLEAKFQWAIISNTFLPLFTTGTFSDLKEKWQKRQKFIEGTCHSYSTQEVKNYSLFFDGNCVKRNVELAAVQTVEKKIEPHWFANKRTWLWMGIFGIMVGNQLKNKNLTLKFKPLKF